MESRKGSALSALAFLLLFCVDSGNAVRRFSGGSKVNRLTVQSNGQWQLLLINTGVVAMHMALTHRDTVVMFDQIGAGPSQYRLRRGYNGRNCTTREDLERHSSCTAHAVEYDISGNTVRPLKLYTDTWCSSGSILSNGTLLQTGGYGKGSKRVRMFRPCRNSHCDWTETKKMLSSSRWYASTARLPESDRVIVVGGRRAPTYEFVPGERSFDLPFLHRTNERRQGGNNLYPFIHLSSDGNLFIFANRDSILFNHRTNRVIKAFPRIPGDGARNYPSSGSSVILPLDHKDKFLKVEVMVCGGSAPGAYRRARGGRFMKGLSSCGRMVITGNKHQWAMENMPAPRLLHDMLILPTGQVLIINGAKRGSAGWKNAATPSLEPYLYSPKQPLGRRFQVQKGTTIPRMYHSSAVALPDGRVLVAGSNPNNRYTFTNVTYPTELRLQAFVPYYMEEQYHDRRPSNVTVTYARGEFGVRLGGEFRVRFGLSRMRLMAVEFSAYAPPFTTHSISMNQRMVRLRSRSVKMGGDGWVEAVVKAPPSENVAPSGYYLFSVVNGGIPSISCWIRFIHA